MKRIFKIFARIFLVFVCVVLFLGIASRSAPNAHASSCYWDGIYGNSTSLSDGHWLYVNIEGLYHSDGSFCGQMRGYALEGALPHNTDGWLSIYLYSCGGYLQAYNYTYVPGGGLYGTEDDIYGSARSISCGYAYAAFEGDTNWHVSGQVQTDEVIG